MALGFGFDLRTFLERTCRACSRYFEGDTDVKMEFHRIFSEGSATSPISIETKDVDEKPIPHDVQPFGEVKEIYEEFMLWKLNIRPIDGLPQQICQDCLERFRSVKSFREECISTQKILQSYFKDLLESSSLGKHSPSSESVKSEPRCSSLALAIGFNAEDLVEEVPDSPERLQHISPYGSPKLQLSPRNVYAESSMGTPPPLFEEIKTEPIDMQTLDYMKAEADLSPDMIPVDKEKPADVIPTKRPTPPRHYTSSDDESSTPTTDEEDNEEDFVPDTSDIDTVVSSNFNRRNPLQCRICYDIFPKRTLLKEHHVRMHPQEKPYICSICGSAFKSNFLLKQHKLKHNQPNSTKCSLCGKYFRSQLHLQRHAKNFHLTSTYTCHICHEKFENYTQLRFQYHVRQHGEKRFQCAFCEKSFHQKIHLRNHERTHTKEQPFRCDICGKAYRQQTACQEHMLTHSDPTPFKCKICQKGFTQRSSLRMHYRTHSDNEKQFLTQNIYENHLQHESSSSAKKILDKRYNKLVQISGHKKSRIKLNHMKIMEIKCQYCDKTFNNSQVHQLHEQQHHEKKELLDCNFCPERFIRAAQLTEHMIAHLDRETYDDDDFIHDYNYNTSI